jgi:serine/threonine protein kinase
MNPMRALMQIPLRASPKLSEPDKWSKEFSDFLEIALEKEPKKRAKIADLLAHPFLQVLLLLSPLSSSSPSLPSLRSPLPSHLSPLPSPLSLLTSPLSPLPSPLPPLPSPLSPLPLSLTPPKKPVTKKVVFSLIEKAAREKARVLAEEYADGSYAPSEDENGDSPSENSDATSEKVGIHGFASSKNLLFFAIFHYFPLFFNLFRYFSLFSAIFQYFSLFFAIFHHFQYFSYLLFFFVLFLRAF